MKAGRKFLSFGVVLGILVAATFLVPAAGVASTHGPSAGVSCQAVGKQPLGKAGAVSLKAQGSTVGTPVTCTAKLTGKWAKNSTVFTISNSGQATSDATGHWTLAPGGNFGPLTNAKLSGALGGAGLPGGTALYIRIDCTVSYPPLKISCTITIGTSPSAAPRLAKTAAPAALPHAKTGTVLCTANGSQPLGNTGVVRVPVRGREGTTPTVCDGLLTGKWAKNSTAFSWDTMTQTTLGPGGTFKAAADPIMGPNGKVAGKLTGSGLPAGSNITIDAGCQVSYPPLKIRCWIIINSAV